ncbi:TPA: fimbrial protein [Serratia marcescens]|nr:fimbrial protein [Serratia marcescens]MBE5300668.1 type 1 fimbrial protein [Serratia marcescens]MBE5301802.1 type 1 fimbrial protein [Serratia marcescens]QDI15509.1 type 1 fimbrial protein [Serratia marcescens]QDI25250.1 type 1 fimbrial protein [Serratia marcescens]HEM7574841.1 type 1 fimbrial protein [Serratia marcescens]
MMNKAIKGIAQGLSICLIGLACAAQAADGTIKTKVKFIQFTCNLTAASKNMRVPLGDINRSQLAKTGSLSSPVLFELKATGCPTNGDTSVGVRFSGTAATGDHQSFVLDQDSVASGVAVKIAKEFRGSYDHFVTPNEKGGAYFGPNSGGEVTLKYAARYVALNDKVTPGTANLTTQIDLFYY